MEDMVMQPLIEEIFAEGKDFFDNIANTDINVNPVILDILKLLENVLKGSSCNSIKQFEIISEVEYSIDRMLVKYVFSRTWDKMLPYTEEINIMFKLNILAVYYDKVAIETVAAILSNTELWKTNEFKEWLDERHEAYLNEYNS